jgi:hypothetical protein
MLADIYGTLDKITQGIKHESRVTARLHESNLVIRATITQSKTREQWFYEQVFTRKDMADSADTHLIEWFVNCANRQFEQAYKSV